MLRKMIWIAVASAGFAMLATAQPRQASIVGGGGPDRGKCTVEVVVDDVAQVEIRGTNAMLRTVSGQTAQWRRFECSGQMPANVSDFRFAGVDGRGRQDLIRDPRNGGVAIIQITDKDGGSEGYTFDIYWGEGGNWDNRGGGDRGPVQRGAGPVGGRMDNGGPDDGGYRPDYRNSDYYRRFGHGFGAEEAVRTCQNDVLRQAQRRFRTNNIHLGRTRMEDTPGRNDWVTGSLDVHRGPREERFRFSCSVNFDTGRVRSVEIDSQPSNFR